MMARIRRRTLTIVLAALGWWSPALGQTPALPSMPDDAVLVAYNVKSCGTRVKFYERDYRTRPGAAGPEFDLMVVGLLDPDKPAPPGPPLAWLFVGSRMEVRDAIVTLPGQPPERLTGPELLRRWPHACDMIEDLRLQAGRRD